MNELRTAALSYAASGILVFPCDETKRPLTENGFKGATYDAETIEAWWAKWPRASIGAPTGSANRVWVLDVDDPKSFEAACQNIGLVLPHTMRAETGKGYHLYFSYDASAPVSNRQKHPKTGWPFAELPGAEVRGEGGYVILPPSVHANGKTYRWAA